MENKKRILAIGLFISLIVVFLAVNILEAAPAVYIETHPFFLLLWEICLFSSLMSSFHSPILFHINDLYLKIHYF